MGIENRVAIITGVTGNLGRVVAQRLAQQGARLALFGTDAERLANLAHELNLSRDRVLTHVVDLRDADATKQAAAAVIAKFGRAEILLHLVGGWTGGKSIPDFTASQVNEMLQQHLWTTWHLVRAFAPYLAANKWGRVIVVSSPTATRPPAQMAPYAVAKAAQEALILTLAQELKDAGVTANILQVRAIGAARGQTSKNETTPEEIAAAILYLCLDEARGVNGARIPLYGGA